MKAIREPAVAGMFYPSSQKELTNQLQLLFDITKNDEDIQNMFGLVSPHAGYMYSGKTAAYGFNTVKDKTYDTIIILSPSHREYFQGISIYNGDAYRTPLGLVPVNKEVRQKFIELNENIFEGIEGHRAEHAVEVQIPFLQYMYKDFSIVPVVMGDQSSKYVDILAETLTGVVDKTLVVASSDLSHFYTKDVADKLDSIIADSIAKFEYDKLQESLESGRCEACGGGAIVAMMKAAKLKHIENSRILNRSDSGDVTGDNSEVVGYLSAAVYG